MASEKVKRKRISPHKYVQNFLKYKYLLQELMRKNIKLQYRRSVLGVFWTFLQPLLTMIILSLVFSEMIPGNKKIRNFPVYLLIGRLVFDFFSNSTKKAMRSIRENSSIIKKVYVPKYVYPLSGILSTFITFLISLTVLVVVVIFYAFTPKAVPFTPYILLSVVPIGILCILSMGIGMILATMAVFFRDVEYLYEVFLMLLMYLTPIFYSPEAIKNSFASAVMHLNPLYSIVSAFRSCVLYGQLFDMNWIYYSLAFSLVTLIIGFYIFYKNQDKFILQI